MNTAAKFFSCFTFFFSSLIAQPFSTYFEYPHGEFEELKETASEWIISKDEMKKWDAAAARAVEQREIDFYDFTRLFTYLYVAQADFSYLSYTLSGEFKGSLDPISNKVLAFFIPNYERPELLIEDPYSEALAKIVFAKVQERVSEENDLPFEFDVPKKLQSSFSAGWQVAKWISWYAKPSMLYWPPAPPPEGDLEWKDQIRLIKETQQPLTEEQKRAIYRWARMAYPWSDDWRSITNSYLWCHEVSLLKSLQVRSMLMIGMYDCVSAYADCKYHYLVLRPQTIDPSIIYVIPVPKHPSYPAGHSTEAALASTMLSFFFPADAAHWKQMAEQCSYSRIWAGIHFPIDIQAGQLCGTKVAQKEIEVFTHMQTSGDKH
jgi:hypothetical protein